MPQSAPRKDATLDVAIVGGGPAGSTCGTLLKKYAPHLEVGIFERDRFPRDHVGESQLPLVCQVLDEMGCWGKVEAANFPIKVGATYKWGRTSDLWDFEFVPNGAFEPRPRPGRYEGQRRATAFQVDRSVYDDILLRHAASMGCRVREEVAVRSIRRDDDRILGLTLDDGTEVQARHYVDCSGQAGALRRALGLRVEHPTHLRNIAVWDYWQNADWAVEIGVGGTRIQVMSLGWGWMWFIPIGPTRTSVGLVVPAEYYKRSGKRPQELYQEAIAAEPRIAALMANATSEGRLASTKDWSSLTERIAGENWFLAGESAGFADPILSAGMTLAQMAGRDVAYTIVSLERGEHDADWLRRRYDESHREKIRQHIRFADFWYTANGCFTDLQELTAGIARDAGLEMRPEVAWQWLGTGGFVDHDSLRTNYGGYSLRAAKRICGDFLGTKPRYLIDGVNVLKLDLGGVERLWGASLADGRIHRYRCFRREGRTLPNVGVYGMVVSILRKTSAVRAFWDGVIDHAHRNGLTQAGYDALVRDAFDALEAMASEGWIKVSIDPSQPTMDLPEFRGEEIVHPNRDPLTEARSKHRPP